MLNEKLIREFTFLVAQTEDALKKTKDPAEKNRNTFRLKNFVNFLKFLKKYPDKKTSIDQLEAITDIGKRIKDRVTEIIKKGKLSEVKRTPYIKKVEKTMESVESLTSIMGIGEKKAHEFIKQGITSAKDLEKKVKSGEVVVNEKIKMALKYYKEYNPKIPRSEMDKVNKFLLKALKNYDPQFKGIICGSYRRGKDQSSDIDFLMASPKLKTMEDINKHFIKSNQLKNFVKTLHKKFIVEDITTKSYTTKYMGFCRLDEELRKIDIRFVPYNSYASALLYFTGSNVFNKKMRKKAQKMGYLLNEYGIYKIIKKGDKKTFKQIPIKTEKDVFDILNMDYLEPSERK
jgi:DNA polymerase/3'-5' exonuclease PolX